MTRQEDHTRVVEGKLWSLQGRSGAKDGQLGHNQQPWDKPVPSNELVAATGCEQLGCRGPVPTAKCEQPMVNESGLSMVNLWFIYG